MAKEEKKEDSKAEKKDDKAEEKKDEKKEQAVKKPPPKPLTPIEEIYVSLSTVFKAVKSKEQRFSIRALRRLQGLRKKTTVEALHQAASEFFPPCLEFLALYKSKPKEIAPMDVIEETDSKEPKAEKPEEETEKEKKKREELQKEKEEWRNLPEAHVYLHLATSLLLIDNNQYPEAAQALTALFAFVQSQNRRSLDFLSAKVYHYYSFTHEKIGKLDTIRNGLLLAHRTACKQHNELGQAALICAILRNYLAYKLYNQADKFRLNSQFPESRSNTLHARYLYYIGQINSVQLHYSDAFANLSQAIRKAPQSAVGFRARAQKLCVIVSLLMGEIPERTVFTGSDLKATLKPYLQLTQAVRVGNLKHFEETVRLYEGTFTRDGVYSLIQRLHHNVIKTGLRKMNLSYSRISIAEVAEKLNFESASDADTIVAKAIHDGVIEASIARGSGLLLSRENIDMYSSADPQAAFHKRILFCTEIHNGAVRALRFPGDFGASKVAGKADDEEQEKDKKDDDHDNVTDLLDDDDGI